MKNQCPVCGYYTFLEPAQGTKERCPVCGWKDEAWQYASPLKDGEQVSLLEARRNYKACGACDSSLQLQVRGPIEEEYNGIGWENPNLRSREEADLFFMGEALKQAKKAAAIEEVPFGCVIVYEGAILARSYNQRNKKHTTLAHAELLAIQKACRSLSDWRVEDCTMYVTLEPCQMCAGAIVQARIPRVVIGAMNRKAGCAGSILNLLEMKEFNHRVDVTRGVREEECAEMMKTFFRKMRKM